MRDASCELRDAAALTFRLRMTGQHRDEPPQDFRPFTREVDRLQCIVDVVIQFVFRRVAGSPELLPFDHAVLLGADGPPKPFAAWVAMVRVIPDALGLADRSQTRQNLDEFRAHTQCRSAIMIASLNGLFGLVDLLV